MIKFIFILMQSMDLLIIMHFSKTTIFTIIIIYNRCLVFISMKIKQDFDFIWFKMKTNIRKKTCLNCLFWKNY